MAIVVTVPQPGQNPGEAETALETPVIQPFVSPNTVARVRSQAASYSPAQQAASNRLNAYLLRHNQMARTAGRQGFVSFVPIVATPRTSIDEESIDESESIETPTELDTAENR
jgi:hypothetical protein